MVLKIILVIFQIGIIKTFVDKIWPTGNLTRSHATVHILIVKYLFLCFVWGLVYYSFFLLMKLR